MFRALPLTEAEATALTVKQRREVLFAASGKNTGWAPYCLVCDSANRMEKREYGFQCTGCGNKIGWNLLRLKQS